MAIKNPILDISKTLKQYKEAVEVNAPHDVKLWMLKMARADLEKIEDELAKAVIGIEIEKEKPNGKK